MVQVPKMVCFFEVAFDNGLRFPLHPFIKRVLQHFNVCPSQLSPNLWGILIGLLVFFRDKGFGVPSIALFLDLFSVKEASQGFLYLSKRAGAPLIILDLHPPIDFGRNVTSSSVAAVGSTIPLIRMILWAFRLPGPLLRIFVSIALV